MRSVPICAVLLVSLASANNNGAVQEYLPPGPPLPNATFSGVKSANNGPSDPKSPFYGIELFQDSGRGGAPIELVHAYHGYWPTGIAVERGGRVFTCFPRGNETFTLGEWANATTEKAWPNQAWNSPPRLESTSQPGTSIASNTSFLFVQSVVIDGRNRLWALDTGRPRIDSVTLMAAEGGPKLVRFDIDSGNAEQVITFPSTVTYPDSSINDVRFDLRARDGYPQGAAYVTDSSPQRAGLIIVNLATGASHRYLDNHYSVTVKTGFVASFDGKPFYPLGYNGMPSVNFLYAFAADGLALSPDGIWLYYSPVADTHMYRVPTDLLRQPPSSSNPYGNILVARAVQDLGSKGGPADGFETNSNGHIYFGAPEQNAIQLYNPNTGLFQVLSRSPLIQWPDTLSVVDLDEGSYLYFTSNQLWLAPDYNNNTDLRVKPYAAYRIRLTDGGKATQTD